MPTPQPVPPTDPARPPAFRAGLAQIRQAETGPTREDPLPTSSSRRRGPLLVGVGAIVLIALVGGAVAALRPDAGPGATTGPAALAGESTSGAVVAPPTTDTTTPASRAGGTPSAARTATAAPTGGDRSGTPASGSPATRSAAPGTTPTGAASGRPTSSGSPAGRPNPYTAAQACGSGYQVIDSATLTDGGGRRQGRVYLLYHSGNGNNCVVTLKDTAVGARTAASAYLEVQGRARSTDSGSFDYYAGPVRAAAAGACVKWGGATGGVSYGSGFEHCG
ncbi:Spore-associated protein A [Micromonospora sp. MH99]|nr:Spore-associated protein A [Micromonospora sp. MH99]